MYEIVTLQILDGKLHRVSFDLFPVPEAFAVGVNNADALVAKLPEASLDLPFRNHVIGIKEAKYVTGCSEHAFATAFVNIQVIHTTVSDAPRLKPPRNFTGLVFARVVDHQDFVRLSFLSQNAFQTLAQLFPVVVTNSHNGNSQLLRALFLLHYWVH